MSVAPYANLTALGGPYFGSGSRSNGASIDGALLPAVTVNPHLAFFPIVFGSYQEVQSVYQFFGENVLIQRRLDLQGGLRGEWQFAENWFLKPRFGYKEEWAQQSQGESLWNGLFKYNRAFAGTSLQRKWGKQSLEVGFDYSATTFPNYHSLTSGPDAPGQNVLDFHSTEVSLIYDLSSQDQRFHWNSNLTWVEERFSDQKVVTVGDAGTGVFSDRNRTDDIVNLALKQTFQVSPRWVFSSVETLMDYISNQNSFDSTQLSASPFTPRYYDFGDVQLNPSLTLLLDQQKWTFTVGGSLGYRQYWDRLAQDGDGQFLSGRAYSMNRGATFTTTYRFWKRWKLVFTGSALTYFSNTRFEQNYPYNYSVYTYLAGLNYEFY